eukprot:Amastigsp_a678484_41.p1 type:complete len:105 gc:universal Amastigsp_a678484_41:87-401(+)
MGARSLARVGLLYIGDADRHGMAFIVRFWPKDSEMFAHLPMYMTTDGCLQPSRVEPTAWDLGIGWTRERHEREPVFVRAAVRTVLLALAPAAREIAAQVDGTCI